MDDPLGRILKVGLTFLAGLGTGDAMDDPLGRILKVELEKLKLNIANGCNGRSAG